MVQKWFVHAQIKKNNTINSQEIAQSRSKKEREESRNKKL